MENQYSIISFLNNRVSEEKIAVGLIMLSNEMNPIIKISDKKLEIVKLLNPTVYNFFVNAIEQVTRGINLRIGKTPNSEFVKELYHSHRTEQGVLHYSFPKLFNGEINEDVFNLYFNKWVENESN